MYQFFCILEVADARLARRVPIEGDLQQEVSAEIDGQVEKLAPDDVEIIPYEPGYKPEDEIFVIKKYPAPGYLKKALETPDALPMLTDEELSEGMVKALFGVEISKRANPFTVAFQNFDGGQVLRRGHRILFLDQKTFQKSERTGLKIGTKVSAVLRGSDLLFQSEVLVRRYLELDEYFEEATDDEIDDLLSHDAFAPSDHQAFMDLADWPSRRKITSILRRGILDKVPPETIAQTGREFRVEVETTVVDGQRRIVVPHEKKAIKRLLRLLDDDLLESPLTDSKYQVTSKRKL